MAFIIHFAQKDSLTTVTNFSFLYLTFYLESYLDGSIDGDKIVCEVMEYFSCWIEDNIRFADAL